MNKKKIIISSIAIITTFFIVIGLIFNKSDHEKLNGLTEIFDVSVNGKIAYVSYHEGKPTIYFKTEEKEQLAVQLDHDLILMDIAFSPNGTTLAYTVSNKDVEASLESTVHILDVRSFDSKLLFQQPSLITEIIFDPKDENKLFYLQAKTFENYSPIARANPHDFDIHSYHFQNETHIQHTKLEKYSMNSLQISYEDEIAYVQMIDDAHVETAEDTFQMNQRVFQIPLEQPEHLSIISDEEREIDIFDFALVPHKHAFIFQSISNANAGDGIFQYELYYYDWKTKEEKRITDLQAFAANPNVIDKEKVYFIVNKQFGKSEPDNYLYEMNINGENIKEIRVEHN